MGSGWRSQRRKPVQRRVQRLDYSVNSYFERTPDNKEGVTIPRWVFPLALLLAGILFVIWFFTSAPWLKVRYINIDGQPTEQTKAEIQKLRGQNILWLSFTRPERVITHNQPVIKEIEILRGIPDTLRVKLIERQAAMIWQSNDHWYTLDPSGFVFREQQLNKKSDGSFDYPGTDLPVVVDTKNLPVSIGQSPARPTFINFIRSLKERLPKEFNLRMVRTEISETTFSITVITDAGWNILFDTTRTLDAQLHTLAKVLEAKRPDIHEYVDIRVRGWVYYK